MFGLSAIHRFKTNLLLGLIVCINFQIPARIPHPALRATLPRGRELEKTEAPAGAGAFVDWIISALRRP